MKNLFGIVSLSLLLVGILAWVLSFFLPFELCVAVSAALVGMALVAMFRRNTLPRLHARGGTALLAFGLMLAILGAPPAKAWDRIPADTEFAGDVILGRSVYLGTNLDPTNKINHNAAQLNAAASNAARSVSTTTVTLTNGQAIALSDYTTSDTLLLTSTVLLPSNAFSAVSSAAIGRRITLVYTGTNTIKLVDAAPAYLAGGTNAAVHLAQYDSLTLLIVATNQIVQTSTSDN